MTSALCDNQSKEWKENLNYNTSKVILVLAYTRIKMK